VKLAPKTEAPTKKIENIYSIQCLYFGRQFWTANIETGKQTSNKALSLE